MNLAWLCTRASQTFSGTFSGTLLHLTWPCTKASQTFSGTFSGILLNLTWLCTKAFRPSPKPSPSLLRNLLWSPVGFAPRLPGTLGPSPESCWTWAGSAPKPPRPPSQTFSGTFGTFSGTSLNLTRRLHQCTPELFWAEDPISLRSGTLLNLSWLCTKASQTSLPDCSGTFGTFSGTSLNLTRRLHQCYSGLKTPLAYAVEKKTFKSWPIDFHHAILGFRVWYFHGFLHEVSPPGVELGKIQGANLSWFAIMGWRWWRHLGF